MLYMQTESGLIPVSCCDNQTYTALWHKFFSIHSIYIFSLKMI